MVWWLLVYCTIPKALHLNGVKSPLNVIIKSPFFLLPFTSCLLPMCLSDLSHYTATTTPLRALSLEHSLSGFKISHSLPFPSSILSAGKPNCHHQTVDSLQPLKLVSITKRPTNWVVGEINLFPCNLIPNSNPIHVASIFTASNNPIIWIKAQSSDNFLSLWQPDLDPISTLLWD